MFAVHRPSRHGPDLFSEHCNGYTLKENSHTVSTRHLPYPLSPVKIYFTSARTNNLLKTRWKKHKPKNTQSLCFFWGLCCFFACAHSFSEKFWGKTYNLLSHKCCSQPGEKNWTMSVRPCMCVLSAIWQWQGCSKQSGPPENDYGVWSSSVSWLFFYAPPPKIWLGAVL